MLSTKIIISFLKELLLSLFRRIGWSVIVERLATRAVIAGLKKLETLSTNDVTKDTVQDIRKMLEGKRLTQLDFGD